MDEKAAFKWYLQGAERGSLAAQYNLALCYQRGKGVVRNREKAFEWILRSAQQNYHDALYKIGNYYRDGIGTSANYSKYVEWYKLARTQSPHSTIAKGLACQQCSCLILHPIEDTSELVDELSVREKAVPMKTIEWSNDMRSVHFEFGGRLGLRSFHDPRNGHDNNPIIKYDGANAAVYIARVHQPLTQRTNGWSGLNSYEEYPLVVKCIFNYDNQAQTTRTIMVCIAPKQ
jgi:hypothetical protein